MTAEFDLYLTPTALEADRTWDVVTQTGSLAERLEAKNAGAVPDPLRRFLTLDIYFGRSRNAGHRAFYHANYSFPKFAVTAAGMLRTIRAEEYPRVVDDLAALMARPEFAAVPPEERDPTALAEKSLRDTFKALDMASYTIRLPTHALAARIADYDKVTQDWVLARYSDEQDEAYYALAAAWLLNTGTVRGITPEQRAEMMALPKRLPPEPARHAAKGWLARLSAARRLGRRGAAAERAWGQHVVSVTWIADQGSDGDNGG